jgi:hypothetical protein
MHTQKIVGTTARQANLDPILKWNERLAWDGKSRVTEKGIRYGMPIYFRQSFTIRAEGGGRRVVDVQLTPSKKVTICGSTARDIIDQVEYWGDIKSAWREIDMRLGRIK